MWLARQVVIDLALIPNVIAGGDDIHAIAEDFVSKLGSNAESAGCILAVGDCQVDILSGNQSREMFRNQAASYGRENIADE